MTNKQKLGGPPRFCSSPDSPCGRDESFALPWQRLLGKIKLGVFDKLERLKRKIRNNPVKGHFLPLTRLKHNYSMIILIPVSCRWRQTTLMLRQAMVHTATHSRVKTSNRIPIFDRFQILHISFLLPFSYPSQPLWSDRYHYSVAMNMTLEDFVNLTSLAIIQDICLDPSNT